MTSQMSLLGAAMRGFLPVVVRSRTYAHHPRVVLVVDGVAEQPGVERRQTAGILTVDHHRAKCSDHDGGIAARVVH
jgi:hypothetical protein